MKHRTLVLSLLLVMTTSTLAVAGAGGDAAIEQVRLKDGSIYRGIITKLVPGDYLELLTPDGQSHAWPMSQVEHYGRLKTAAPPVATAPAPYAPHDTPQAANLVKVQAAPVSLRLESPQPNVSFYYKTGEAVAWVENGYVAARARGADFRRICTAPCRAEIPAGRYQLALADDEHRVLEFPDTVNLEQPSLVTGSYKSNQALRIMGWVLTGISFIGGTAMMLGAIKDTDDYYDDGIDDGLMWGGGLLMGLGGTVGLVMALYIDDEVHIEVEPLATAMATNHKSAASAGN